MIPVRSLPAAQWKIAGSAPGAARRRMAAPKRAPPSASIVA